MYIYTYTMYYRLKMNVYLCMFMLLACTCILWLLGPMTPFSLYFNWCAHILHGRFFKAVHKIIVLLLYLPLSISLFLSSISIPLFFFPSPLSLLLSSFPFLPSYSNQYDRKLEEVEKNILHTHTTAISTLMLYQLWQQVSVAHVVLHTHVKIFKIFLNWLMYIRQ